MARVMAGNLKQIDKRKGSATARLPRTSCYGTRNWQLAAGCSLLVNLVLAGAGGWVCVDPSSAIASLVSPGREQPLFLEMAEPFAEHIFGIHAVVKAGLTRLDGADDRGTRRPVGSVGEAEIRELERFTYEGVNVRR